MVTGLHTHTSSPSSHCHHTRALTSPIIHLYLLGKRCPLAPIHYIYIVTMTTGRPRVKRAEVGDCHVLGWLGPESVLG